MIEFIQGLNWVIVGQIILIDILLGVTMRSSSRWHAGTYPNLPA